MTDTPPGRRPPGDRGRSLLRSPVHLALIHGPALHLAALHRATAHLALIHGPALHLAALHRATAHLALIHGPALHLAALHRATAHLACGPFVRGTAGEGPGGHKQRGDEGRE